jgi:hypothetical protein
MVEEEGLVISFAVVAGFAADVGCVSRQKEAVKAILIAPHGL